MQSTLCRQLVLAIAVLTSTLVLAPAQAQDEPVEYIPIR